ncbi:MAG: hypothetical protein WBD47_16145 [Phormidesmis sp.]
MLKKTLAFGLLAAATFGLSVPAQAQEVNDQNNQVFQGSNATAAAIGNGADASVWTEQEAHNFNFIGESEDGYSPYGYGYRGGESPELDLQNNDVTQMSNGTAAAIGHGADAEVYTEQEVYNENFIYSEEGYDYYYSPYGS